jgi:hypothetical protein
MFPRISGGKIWLPYTAETEMSEVVRQYFLQNYSRFYPQGFGGRFKRAVWGHILNRGFGGL